MTIGHLGLKVKVMGQGNAVGLTSVLDRGQFLATGYTRPRGVPVASCSSFSPEAQIAIN